MSELEKRAKRSREACQVLQNPSAAYDEIQTLRQQLQQAEEENERVRQANLDVMMHFDDMKAEKEKAEARCAELEANARTDNTQTLYNALKRVDELEAENEALRGRVAELSNLCERLQHCAQGFYVDQGDYGHMEAIMQDYHAIMRGDSAQSKAFRIRLQAEGVIDAHNAMSDSFVLEATGAIQERAVLRCQDFLNDYAERLRAEADQMEGGEGCCVNTET